LSAVNLFKFLVIKTLDPDWIRIGFQPKMLDPDPDPYQMNRYGSETLVRIISLRLRGSAFTVCASFSRLTLTADLVRMSSK
jgi:hypothetical protein